MSHLVKSYICETCNICCSGPENYLQHKASAKHQKKEQQHKLGSGLPGVSGDSGTSAAQPFPGLSFHCEVCQTSMTGPESQDAHMKGAPHAKKVRQLRLIQELNNSGDFSVSPSRVAPSIIVPKPEPVAVVPKFVNATTNEEMIQKMASMSLAPNVGSQMGLHFCEVCQVSISGPDNAQQHYQGSQHRKKSARLGVPIDNAVLGMIFTPATPVTQKWATPRVDFLEIAADDDAEVILRACFEQGEESVSEHLGESD